MNVPRLISRVDVLEQLLAAVAAVPAGVKLSIPALRDALVSQADVLAGLETLVAAGELDRATLRPRPGDVVEVDLAEALDAVPIPAIFVGPTGAELAAELDALIVKHGLSKTAVSVAVGHGNSSWIEVLRRGNPRPKTVERVRSFLADPPLDKLLPRAPLGDRRFAPPTDKPAEEQPGEVQPPPSPPASAELAAEVDSFLVRSGMSASAFGQAINGDASLVKAIRAGRSPRRKTVAKIRELLAKPPKVQAPPSTPVVARRDPTQKPATPLMDLGERQRLNGQRHHANVRRAQEREATALVDRGVDPSSVKSTFQANAMRQVQDRRDREARQADPVEQAKLALQRKGLVVYSASVSGGRKDRFIVSGQQDQLSPAELIALAERKTGLSFRRAAGALPHVNPDPPAAEEKVA